MSDANATHASPEPDQGGAPVTPEPVQPAQKPRAAQVAEPQAARPEQPEPRPAARPAQQPAADSPQPAPAAPAAPAKAPAAPAKAPAVPAKAPVKAPAAPAKAPAAPVKAPAAPAKAPAGPASAPAAGPGCPPAPATAAPTPVRAPAPAHAAPAHGAPAHAAPVAAPAAQPRPVQAEQPRPVQGERAAAKRAAVRPEMDESLFPSLVELAQAYGVATEFWDWQGRHTTVPRSTILAVLAALDVDASSEAAIARSLVLVRERPWRQVLPDVVVVREGARSRVAVHVDHGSEVEVRVALEDGTSEIVLAQEERWVDPKMIEGRLVGEASFTIPADLPLGWHRLQARFPGGEDDRPLVVTPQRVDLPKAMTDKRAWGFMTQLYSVRSQYSWGLGDLSDLTELATWSARDHGADFVLLNPLHAAEPIAPMEPSPYLPTTRRFVNPIYLRVEDIREVAYMPSTDRALIEWQAEAMRGMNIDPGELDRDGVWEAKRAALETVFAQPRSRARQASFEAFCDREGEGLLDFATWCALAERYGLPMATWPAHALDARSRAVGQLREELAERVQFYMWLQWCLDEQLASAQRLAREAGMGLGIVHDLAVGVHPDGADAWALADVLAGDVTVGAPPDAFNQHGQDWSQPPWRPDRLAELGYAPLPRHAAHGAAPCRRRSGSTTSSGCSGCGGSRARPAPAQGTYVRYDHEAMIGILALEAHRAGAVVVGEDLGTVEPWARDYLRERGLLGTSILWFERDQQGRPLPPQALARAVPGHGHHPRPAADRRLPGRGAHRAARPFGSAHPRCGRGGPGGRGRSGRRTGPAAGAGAARRTVQ